MSYIRKVLGQVLATAVTETDLYTVPSNTNTVISSIIICNTSVNSSTFRIYIRVAGESTNNKQYLYYDTPINGNDSFVVSVGITLSETDVVTVYSSSGNLVFNLFGQENN
jgi:hypothetical protein